MQYDDSGCPWCMMTAGRKQKDTQRRRSCSGLWRSGGVEWGGRGREALRNIGREYRIEDLVDGITLCWDVFGCFSRSKVAWALAYMPIILQTKLLRIFPGPPYCQEPGNMTIRDIRLCLRTHELCLIHVVVEFLIYLVHSHCCPSSSGATSHRCMSLRCAFVDPLSISVYNSLSTYLSKSIAAVDYISCSKTY